LIDVRLNYFRSRSRKLCCNPLPAFFGYPIQRQLQNVKLVTFGFRLGILLRLCQY